MSVAGRPDMTRKVLGGKPLRTFPFSGTQGRKSPRIAEILAEFVRRPPPAATDGGRGSEPFSSPRDASPRAGRFPMSRRKKRPEPFFRRFDGWWYVQIGKRQIKLAQGEDNEDAAWRAYYRVMAEQGPATPAAALRDPTVTAVCNLFLDFSEKAHAERTYAWYRDFLEDFRGFAGKLRLSELDSSHVAAWLDRHPDWKGTRRGATIAVKRAF